MKSKRIRAVDGRAASEDEASAEEEADTDAGGANCHWRAAFSARSAKNWLAAGLASSAEETVPSGLSCTRTFMRTLPRMVLRAFSDTSGRILRITVGATGLALTVAGADVAGGGVAADFEIGAEVFEFAMPEADGEELLAREFVFGDAAGGVALRELAAGDGVGGFALREFTAGELVAFPDLADGAAMVAGALEATMGFDEAGELFAGEAGKGETELDAAGAAEFPGRER